MLDYNFTLLAITLFFTIFIFWRSILFRRHITRQSDLLVLHTQRLKEISGIEETHSREEDFQTNLKQAEVITELQGPRSSFMLTPNGKRPPERYQYAKSMLDSGMKTEEISTALRMSSNEISQVLKLVTLCCNDEKIQNS